MPSTSPFNKCSLIHHDMNHARCARDSRFVYGSSTEFSSMVDRFGAQTVAESPFDKPANATR